MKKELFVLTLFAFVIGCSGGTVDLPTSTQPDFVMGISSPYTSVVSGSGVQ